MITSASPDHLLNRRPAASSMARQSGAVMLIGSIVTSCTANIVSRIT